MRPEEFSALNEVFERRLHHTRDSELQALLWQLGEYTNEVDTERHMAVTTLATIARLLNVYQERNEMPESKEG